MKIDARIAQSELELTSLTTITQSLVVGVEFRCGRAAMEERTADSGDENDDEPGGEVTPTVSLDALLAEGRYDSEWLLRIVRQSMAETLGITSYYDAACRNGGFYFLPSIQSSVTKSMSHRLKYNSNLLVLPTLDWSEVEDVSGMCFRNIGMVEADMPFSGNIRLWTQAFYSCTSLCHINRLDLSSAENIADMFNGCTSLRAIPMMNTSRVTDFTGFVNGCTSLQSIESIDFSSAQSDINLGSNQYTKLNALTNIVVSGTISQNIKIFADNLTETSARSIMNALVASPLEPRTITITKVLANKISEATKRIASDKVWNLLTV